MSTWARWVMSVSCLLGGLQSGHAIAQSTIGMDFFLGYQLGAGQHPLGTLSNPNGLDPFHKNSRSPTGLLYLDPRAQPQLRPLGDEGWQMSFSAELGTVFDGGTADTATYREYADLDDGGLIGRVAIALEKPESATFFKLDAAAIGRGDTYAQASGGRYGAYRIAGFYNEIPHQFSTNAQVLWEGSGTPFLTLPPSLTPGASTLDAVRAAFVDASGSSIAVDRTQYGVSLTAMPSDKLTLTGRLDSEERDGGRPWGGAMNFPLLGQVMETIEPIDYRTTDFSFGMAYATPEHQANLLWTSSFFRNEDAALTWENAGLAAFQGDFIPTQGRMSLAPDNDYHHFKLDYARALPFWRSRVSVSGSYSRMEQNDRLLPPTISSGVTAGFPAIDLDQWNSEAALSRTRADALITHWSGFARWVGRPSRKLKLSASVRLLDQDNDTEYLALNPLTGQYGYIAVDGGISSIPNRSGVYDPDSPGNRVRIASIPFEKDTLKTTVGADYKLSRMSTLGLSYIMEQSDFAYREREEITDDKIRLQFHHRGNGSIRLAYEYVDRSGDSYDFNPYEPFYSSSLPGYLPRFDDGNNPHTLSSLRKFDLASREEHSVDLKSVWLLSEQVDLNLTGRWQQRDYDAQHGLLNADQYRLGMDVSYHPAVNSTWFAFAHWQDMDRDVSNINDPSGNGGSRSSDPDPGGVNYPFENEWTQSVSERNTLAGFGLSQTLGELELQITYTYTTGETRSRYLFASSAAFGNLPEAEVGTDLPDQSFRHQLFQADLSWAIRTNVRLNLTYRFEKETLRDFHYQGLDSPVVEVGQGADIYLAAFPENYVANLFITSVQWTF